MSVEAMALVLHHTKARAEDRMVLIGIANHAGDGGAWPTLDTLARYSNRSKRAVQYSIERLEALGEIEVALHEGGTTHTDPRYRPNRYEILVVCPAECDHSMNHRMPGTQPVARLNGSGVQPSASRGATQRVPGVQPVAPEPPLEPSSTGPASAPSSRTRRTSPESDAITNEWWERNVEEHGWKPENRNGVNAWVTARGIVHRVLTVENYTSDEVRQALLRIGPRMFNGTMLSDFCYGIRKEQSTGQKPLSETWWNREANA